MSYADTHKGRCTYGQPVLTQYWHTRGGRMNSELGPASVFCSCAKHWLRTGTLLTHYGL